MRWRVDLAYNGKNYSGWQKQPGDVTVQQTLEQAFKTILREQVEITGCGRTDAGVHSRNYTCHLDVEGHFDTDKTAYHVNAILPDDIGLKRIREVDPDFHARYSAIQRHYRYYIHFNKDPFLDGISYRFQRNKSLDTHAMIRAAGSVILAAKEFFPFCKTDSDAKHYRCELTKSLWFFKNENEAIYSISANRFLRGMVRLIVGATLNIGLGKLSEADLEECITLQKPLPVSWSVPPEGLFLEEVSYVGESIQGSGWHAFPPNNITPNRKQS
jgi:tRNA pseudouridine38-40 synthase